MQTTFFIADAEKMQQFGQRLAQFLRLGDIIFLQGQLGTGKTTLVRGIMRGLEYSGQVKSPTFTLVESYSLRQGHLFHFDLYRVRNTQELFDIGIEDYFTADAIIIIEWPENAKSILPIPTIFCEIEMSSEGRKIILSSEIERGAQLINHVIPLSE